LSLLDPHVIYALATIMAQSRSDKIQRFLLEAIAHVAKRDFRPMQELLFGPDRDLAGQVVFTLRFLTDDHSRRILLRLLKDESELIRKQALKALLARDEHNVEDIFFLIDDSNQTIRELLLSHLARERNQAVERRLQDYLASTPAIEKDPDHFKAVCRTLGKCGSDGSLPLLKKRLFKWPRLGVLRGGNNIQRQGASIALQELDIGEAAHLIKRSHQGILKNIFRPA
jgi:hypothetical protein